jgi:hypothetical protein
MRSVVKALPEGDSKADDECPICMEAVAACDWQVRTQISTGTPDSVNVILSST